MAISIQADSAKNTESVQLSVQDLMERRRQNRRTEFNTASASDLIRAEAIGSRTVSRLLAVIGAISMIVGGIGIMNVMLANVTERTREIGIRLALGTRRRKILQQFVLEAASLSALGGCAGVLAGAFVSSVVTSVNDWPTRVTMTSVTVALVSSVSVGILFGWHPAKRAASLEPILALRLE